MKAPYKTRAAFENDFAKLAALEQQKADKANALQAAMHSTQSAHQPQIDAINAQIDALTERLTTWAEAHRGELTEDGKHKTVTLPYGALKWRKLPSTVRIDGELEEIIAELKKRRLGRLIRVKTELNKAAVLAEADKFSLRPVAGLEIIEGGERLTLQAGGGV